MFCGFIFVVFVLPTNSILFFFFFCRCCYLLSAITNLVATETSNNEDDDGWWAYHPPSTHHRASFVFCSLLFCVVCCSFIWWWWWFCPYHRQASKWWSTAWWWWPSNDPRNINTWCVNLPDLFPSIIRHQQKAPAETLHFRRAEMLKFFDLPTQTFVWISTELLNSCNTNSKQCWNLNQSLLLVAVKLQCFSHKHLKCGIVSIIAFVPSLFITGVLSSFQKTVILMM